MVAYVRRQEILEVLCQRRHEIMNNLANEFNVCRKTIQNDILELSIYFPIYTKPGSCGGVFVSDGYYVGRRYLNSKQENFLRQIASSFKGEEADVIQSIITQFAKPNTWLNSEGFKR